MANIMDVRVGWTHGLASLLSMNLTDAMRLDGLNAVVTGASGGLGAHFAKVLAKAGATVCLVARDTGRLEAVATAIQQDNGCCSSLVLDVTDVLALKASGAVFREADILINNAGITRETRFLDHKEADWDAVINLNLRSVYLVAQLAARGMAERGSGSIVNIASILGLRQAQGIASYCVSKAGVVQLTKVMALELARHNVRVNAIAPGYFETALNAAYFASGAGRRMIKHIPQRRIGNLAELDGPLLLLASGASSYMTGTVLTVDGGHLVSSL